MPFQDTIRDIGSDPERLELAYQEALKAGEGDAFAATVLAAHAAAPDALLYGAWREKVLYGKKSIGMQRSTYLIDADGKVAKVWKKVNVDGHDDQVIAALKELGYGACGAP